MTSLAGQTALVTGGAKRVGRAIALALAERGANVAITYRTSAGTAEQTLADLRARGVSAAAVCCDQSDRLQVHESVTRVEAALGPVEILINNASIFARTPITAVSEEDWDAFLSTNLKGPFWFCQAVAPGMRERGHGQILNLVDVAAERPWADYSPYCASKAGLISLTKSLAWALAPEVRVNAIAPGAILWPDDWTEEQQQAYLERVPLGRVGTPEEIAAAAMFLLERADFVTGQVLHVDGGRALL